MNGWDRFELNTEKQKPSFTHRARVAVMIVFCINLMTSAFGAMSASASSVPPGLPNYFAIGLQGLTTNFSWITGSRVPWNYVYNYINGPSANGAAAYTQWARQNGYIPVFDWYTWDGSFSDFNSPSYMNTYFNGYITLLQNIVTGNSAAWDPNYDTQLNLSNGNLTISATAASAGGAGFTSSGLGTDSFSSGKWYYEYTYNSLVNSGPGFANSTFYKWDWAGGPNSIGVYGPAGNLFFNGAVVTNVGSISNGTTIGLAIDLTNRLFWVYANGKWNGSSTANPATGVGGLNVSAMTGPVYPAVTMMNSTDSGTANFGATAFSFAVPSGFQAWGSGVTASPVIVDLEPDFWSFMQQTYGNDPTVIPAAIASSGISGLGNLPNNAAGYAQALVTLKNHYAPTVLLAFNHSPWAVNFDATCYYGCWSTPAWYGSEVVNFIQKLGAKFDLIFYNTSDADAGYNVNVRGYPSAYAWWTNAAFSNFQQYIAAIYQGTGLQGMLWQTPIGNTIYDTDNNTPYHYQDNRPQYFLQSGNAQNIKNYVNAGVIGILFGPGQSTDTAFWDAAGDGITNPAPIDGNTQVSNYADDDGGFLRLSAAAYYSSGPVAIGSNAISSSSGINAVRASSNQVTGGASVSASIANNGGDALIVACRQGADQTSISSVTDTAGNSYTLVNKSSSSGGGSREDALFVAFNVPSSANNTVSCNFASNLTSYTESIIVEEFSGLTGAIDGSVVSSNSSGAATTLGSGNLTTTNASDLLVYEVNQWGNVTFTAGPGYTISPGAATGRQALEYQVVKSTGTYSASMSWSPGASADGVFAAFKGN
jgi:hypothetical protein